VKLHDLKPAPGSRTERMRVGRGIAAGKGKTAGRGTKGQKARAGGTIPAWFEGGQTPAHMRLPKLHGFRRPWRIDYQVVNVGRISEYAAAGRFGSEPGSSPLTVNSEVLRGAGLISTERQPVKVLGHGDVTVKLFVAAEAFTKSAREKIEAAGGFVQPLTVTAAPAEASAEEAAPAEKPARAAKTAKADKSATVDKSNKADRTVAIEKPATTSTAATATEAAETETATADEPAAVEEPAATTATAGSEEHATAEAAPTATAETSSEDESEPATKGRRSRKSADSAGE
jgi:large subunit ribosomal protein L15